MSTQVETKHTPGPWKVEPARLFDITGNFSWFTRIYAEDPGPEHDFTVALARDVDKPTREANALLIAAAPDLLAKCEKLADWLDHLADLSAERAKDTRFITLSEANASDSKNYRKTADDIKTAIRKAKGE